MANRFPLIVNTTTGNSVQELPLGDFLDLSGSGIANSGNITVNASSFFIGNGSQLTGLAETYGNANVAAYLPTYTGNLAALTGIVTTTANITGGNVLTGGAMLATGNITGGNVLGGANVNATTHTGTTVSVTGNITCNYFVGNGSQLSGGYGNSNVAAYLPTYTGNLASATVDGTDKVGFLNVPQNSQSAAYTLVLTDAGKHIYHPVGDANARTYTIPANASVAYPIGTVISFINMTSQVVSIAITSDTMYFSSAGTTGTRSLAIYGSATAIKITATTWLISGSGLT